MFCHRQRLLQGKGYHDKHRHLRGMEGKDAKVQAKEFRPPQAIPKTRRVGLTIRVKCHHTRIRGHKIDYADRDKGQDTGQQEHARHADPGIQGWAGGHRAGKGETDGHTDHAHRLSAFLLARQIGQQGGCRRRNSPRPLQGTTGDNAVNTVGVITGLSGSGKSSLAFDSLYALRVYFPASLTATRSIAATSRPCVSKLRVSSFMLTTGTRIASLPNSLLANFWS